VSRWPGWRDVSRLDPPWVLLDSTFIAAVINHDEPFHADAVAAYADLLDRFEHDQVLLAATSDSLAELAPNVRASMFAPVTTLVIAEQHRNASLDVYGSGAKDPDFATMLVIAHREHIAAIASFDARFDRFDVDLVPPRSLDAPGPLPPPAQ
jgi:predicted nucleic acid-binding protein